MRKLIFLVLALALLALPNLAAAQSEVTFEEVQIQLWPEYDRPEVLVMYSISFPAETTLPVEAQVHVPANAALNAVAKLSGDAMLTVPYDTPSREGEWMTLNFQVDELTTYRVEYYLPLEKDGVTRNINFRWESNHPVTAAFVQVLEPPGTKNFTATPAFSDSAEQNGMKYHTLSVGEIPASERLDIAISYDKDNDDLTVSSLPVEMSGTKPLEMSSTEEPPSETFSFTQSLPLILGVFGALLIVGGVAYFFLSGRGKDDGSMSRKRHKISDAGARYCHECGSRAGPNDKFCRSCGAKLRK